MPCTAVLWLSCSYKRRPFLLQGLCTCYSLGENTLPSMLQYLYMTSSKRPSLTTASFCVCVFLGLHPRHMEIPLAYTTAIVPPDPSCICHLHHSSRQCRILNPLSEAGVWICILMDTSRVHYHWVTRELPDYRILNEFSFLVIISPFYSLCSTDCNSDYPYCLCSCFCI